MILSMNRMVTTDECSNCLQPKGKIHYTWCDVPGKCGGPLDGWGLTAQDIELAMMELSLAIARAKQ